MKLALCAWLLISCVVPPTPADTQAALLAQLPTVVDCYDPSAYGAVPTPPGGQMIDARPGIQAAVEAAGDVADVCLGAGRWEVSRAPIGSYDRFASIYLRHNHVVLHGVGPATVIAPTGDAGAGDWRGIEVLGGAVDVEVRDLAIDTSGMTNTEEQDHAMQVTGPVAGFRVSRVRFNHPHPAGAKAGDCLRLVGNAGALVRDVSISDVTFDACARSGIAIQRGVWGVQVIGSRFNDVHDTDVDDEPTAAGGDGDLTLMGNHFNDTGVGQGDFSVSLGGWDAPQARVRVIGNDFSRRGLWGYRVAQLTVAGNTFEVAPTQKDGGVVELRNVEEDFVISANTIKRLGTVPGSALRVVHQAAGSAAHGTVSSNRISSATPGQVISIESATDLTLSDLDVDYTGAATGQTCVYVRATAKQVDMLDVHDVRCRAVQVGGFLAAISLSSSTSGFGSVLVHANMSRNALQGLRCDGSGAFTKPIVFHGNDFDGANPIATSCAQALAPQVP